MNYYKRNMKKSRVARLVVRPLMGIDGKVLKPFQDRFLFILHEAGVTVAANLNYVTLEIIEECIGIHA